MVLPFIVAFFRAVTFIDERMQEHFVYLRLSCRCHPLLRWGWQVEKCFQARQKHGDAWNKLLPAIAT